MIFSFPVILLDEFMKIFVRLYRQKNNLNELEAEKKTQ